MGEGGVSIPPKSDDVIYEQPLISIVEFFPSLSPRKECFNMVTLKIAHLNMENVENTGRVLCFVTSPKNPK